MWRCPSELLHIYLSAWSATSMVTLNCIISVAIFACMCIFLVPLGTRSPEQICEASDHQHRLLGSHPKSSRYHMMFPWFPISERKLLRHIKVQFTIQSFPVTLSLFELTLHENNFYKILPRAWTNMMCPFFVLECMVLSVLSIFGRWSARTTFSSLAQVWWDIFTIWLQGLNLKIIQWSHEYFK